MKRILTHAVLIVTLITGVGSQAAQAQHGGRHRGENRVCQIRYRQALRQASRLRGRARDIRMAEARRELRRCMSHR